MNSSRPNCWRTVAVNVVYSWTVVGVLVEIAKERPGIRKLEPAVARSARFAGRLRASLNGWPRMFALGPITNTPPTGVAAVSLPPKVRAVLAKLVISVVPKPGAYTQ